MTRLHALMASMVPLNRRQIEVAIIELMMVAFIAAVPSSLGRTSPPLTAKHSRDDIARANNGAFIGVASDGQSGQP